MNQKETTSLEIIYKLFLKNLSVSTDTRLLQKNDIFFALSGENFNGNIFAEKALQNEASIVVIDDDKFYSTLKNKFPALSEKIILVNNTLKMLQLLAARYRSDLKIPFLAITGSNGKTTTKELVREVISKKYNVLATSGNFNNHIGVPLTILSIKPSHEFAIIEMGANHIGEIKDLVEIAKPNYGIITNIGIAHIGEFGNFENIINTKKELYDGVLKNKGKIFINENDKILKEISKDFKNEDKIFYIEANELPTNDNYLRLELNNQLLKTSLVGNYNIPNVQAAYTVGKFFKISEDKILKSITEYTPTNNRSQKENSDMNNTIIWDCYNANPTSMGLAIESFTSTNTNNNYFFLGEMAELGEYSYSEHLKLLTVLEELNGIKVLIGNEFKKIVEYSEKEQEKFVFLNNVDELENFIKSRKIINSNILIKGSNSTKLFNLYGKKII